MRLIDADALQRRICGANCGCEYEDCGSEHDCNYDFFIFNAPTIEAEPVKHGRWIEHFATGICFCSECDCDAVEAYTNYCPNCGCKMDLEG